MRMRGNTLQGIKNAFPVPRARGLEIFQTNSHNSNFGRSSDECMTIINVDIHDSTPEIGIDFQYTKCSLGRMVDVTADVNHMLYLALLNKVYCSYGKIVFQCVSLL